MHNLIPSRSLERRSRNLLIGGILLVLLGAFLAALGGFLFAIEFVVPSNPSFSLYDTLRRILIGLGFLLVLVGLILVARALTWRTDNELALKTGTALAEFLDEKYAYIRNVSRLSIGYIDAILVGPPGVLVFRITRRQGVYFNEGENWMRQIDDGQWRTMRWSPTHEALVDMEKLREYLVNRGLNDVPVYGVVVFLQDEPLARITRQKPVLPVAHPSELSYTLADTYFAENRIDTDTVRRIVQSLYP